MKKTQSKADNNALQAWKCFEQTGKVCDYLSYCAQDSEHMESINKEGIENNAGDSKRTGYQGTGTQQ